MESLYADAQRYDQLFYLERDLPFWSAVAGRPGGRVLELGCGSGRVAIPLSKAGVCVTGIDSSKAMLEGARAKASEAGVELTLLEGDMRRFLLPRKFDRVIIPNNSLCHLLTLPDVLACLRSAKTALAEHGRLVLDVFVPALKFLLGHPDERRFLQEFVDPASGERIRVFESAEYDSASQVKRSVFHYVHEDGRERAEPFHLRMYFPQELETLLMQAGFTVEMKFGDYNLAPFDSASSKQLIIAR